MGLHKPLAALLCAPLAIGAALYLGFDVARFEADRDLIHRETGFVGATTCRRCHPDQHASWERTFHSSMTQRVTGDTVVGDFSGEPRTFYGQTARPFRDGDRFAMELPDKRIAEVALAVGSRRYQQYFERVERGEGFVFRRLPILWHIGAKRWLHLNGVFLGPDSKSWEQHASIWNQNCVFCHNTGPRPGYIPQARKREIVPNRQRAFDSEVATLGIGCESCHGPGREHVAKYESIVTRYGDHFADDNDTRIVHPNKLDQERSVAVCGQCHGQRVPSPLSRHFEWRDTGPTYRSGDKLVDHVTAIRADTRMPGEAAGQFQLRFWKDGTPRLTAYEYQGVTSSPCYLRGTMTCGSCHVMHGGDVHGQIEPEMRGNRACLQCHDDIARDVPAHTKHAANSSGSECLECHMPRMVYGILDVHRSHRIESPNPKRDAEAGRPNACTSCHLDKSPLWAADRMREWWGEAYQRPRTRPDKAPLELSDAVASILSGDPVQRVVYAKHAGRSDSPVPGNQKALLRVALHATLLDAYPSIRWTAQKSLLALERELALGVERLAEWRHDDDKQARDAAAKAMLQAFSGYARGKLNAPLATDLLSTGFEPQLDAIIRLLNLQSQRAISIGE